MTQFLRPLRADSVNVGTVSGTGGNTSAVEAVSVALTGTNYVTINGGGTATKTVTLTGAGTNDVTFADVSGTVTIDASATTGAFFFPNMVILQFLRGCVGQVRNRASLKPGSHSLPRSR